MPTPEFDPTQGPGYWIALVAGESRGGQYPADAYRAGWDAALAWGVMQWIKPPVYRCKVATPNLAQMDLLAMDCGYTLTSEPMPDYQDLLLVTLTRNPEPDPTTAPVST